MFSYIFFMKIIKFLFRRKIFNSIDLLILSHDIFFLLSKKYIYFFSGDIGVGKTSLIKCILKNFGLYEIIKSPTYPILEEYFVNNISVFHYDFYRLLNFDNNVFDNYIRKNGIHFFEWGDLYESNLPYPDISFIFLNFYYYNIILINICD